MTIERPAGPWRFALLLVGNAALALGPLLVRLADTGPVAAGFWRLALALPLLAALGLRGDGRRGHVKGGDGRGGARIAMPPRAILMLALAAGVAFGLDIASWHLGIALTRTGNAAVFGNSGSVIVVGFGLIVARRAPHLAEIAAIGSAIAGAALLMGGSLELGAGMFAGDLLSLLAGLFYAVYILLMRHVRGSLGSWRLLFISSLAATPVLLVCALLLGERIVPIDWTPVVLLSLCSQIVGQGILIWALGWFRPLVIGLALMTQPAIAALSGWIAFGETLGPVDMAGMVLMAVALLLARVAEPKAAT